MPEIPDFDQIARQIVGEPFVVRVPTDPVRDIVEALRVVWNARGAADRAAVFEIEGHDQMLEHALRRLDR